MEDRAIIALFFARSEQAIRELDGKYGSTCHRLSNQILNDRRDAEECVNDAYLGMWNSIPPVRPDPLLAYLCRVVRNLSLKCLERRRAAKRNSAYEAALEELEECIPAPGAVEEQVEARELARLIESFLDGRSREDRAIFLGRYWFADPYGEIARRTGLSEKNVSVRLTRLRKQLREYLEQRGVTV